MLFFLQLLESILNVDFGELKEIIINFDDIFVRPESFADIVSFYSQYWHKLLVWVVHERHKLVQMITIEWLDDDRFENNVNLDCKLKYNFNQLMTFDQVVLKLKVCVLHPFDVECIFWIKFQ